MKALKFITLIAFMLFFLGGVYAQTTKTLVVIENETFPIYCDSESETPSDVLMGNWTFNLLLHTSKNNSNNWEKHVGTKSEYVSTWTGEVFKEVWVYQYNESKTSSNRMIMHRIWRLSGDMGSHFICNLTMEIDPETGDYELLKHNHKCL